jgi:hypothetical protein
LGGLSSPGRRRLLTVCCPFFNRQGRIPAKACKNHIADVEEQQGGGENCVLVMITMMGFVSITEGDIERSSRRQRWRPVVPLWHDDNSMAIRSLFAVVPTPGGRVDSAATTTMAAPLLEDDDEGMDGNHHPKYSSILIWRKNHQ